MIRPVIAPDKIWDLKYNKNNKLLHKINSSDETYPTKIDCITTKLSKLWQRQISTIEYSANTSRISSIFASKTSNSILAYNSASTKIKLYNAKKSNITSFKQFYLFALLLYCCSVMIAAAKPDPDIAQQNETNKTTSIYIHTDNNSTTYKANNNNNNNNNNYEKNISNINNSSLVKHIENLSSTYTNDSQIYINIVNSNNNITSKVFSNSSNIICENIKCNNSISNVNENIVYNYINTTTTTNVANSTEQNYPAYVQTRKILEASNTLENEEDYFEDDDDDERDYKMLISNKSGTTFNLSRSQSIEEAKGMYVGAPCEVACHPDLHHVQCDRASSTCECDKNYPVVIGLTRGCAKPKKLGEQCFYHQTCVYNDANSLCIQISHNALCQCADGFHSVSYTKPTKRVFCTQDLAVLTSDLPTLLGVTSGIAVLAGLICMVLHLFSKTKYPRHRNYADANIPPPIMYSSDTGIPLTVQSGRPSSRSSLRSSGSIGSYGNRRPSSAPQHGSKGVLVSTSRTGSRRPSLASVHSTSSSVRSYSMMRFEKEIQQKELRHEMKLRLSRLQHPHYNHNKPQIVVGDLAHSSISKAITPITPNSTDELLPSVDESQEFSPKLNTRDEVENSAAYNGPCTSSSECL